MVFEALAVRWSLALESQVRAFFEGVMMLVMELMERRVDVPSRTNENENRTGQDSNLRRFPQSVSSRSP